MMVRSISASKCSIHHRGISLINIQTIPGFSRSLTLFLSIRSCFNEAYMMRSSHFCYFQFYSVHPVRERARGVGGGRFITSARLMRGRFCRIMLVVVAVLVTEEISASSGARSPSRSLKLAPVCPPAARAAVYPILRHSFSPLPQASAPCRAAAAASVTGRGGGGEMDGPLFSARDA